MTQMFVLQFNDRATSLARLNGGTGLAGSKFTLAIGFPGVSTPSRNITLASSYSSVGEAAIADITTVVGVPDLGTPSNGFKRVKEAGRPDTVSVEVAFRLARTLIAGLISRWPGRAGRSGRSAVVSPCGVLAAALGPICGPLGDRRCPTRFHGARGRHVGAQLHLLEQHQQQQLRPRAGREVGRISPVCRGPPCPGRFAVQQVAGRLVDPREEIRSRTSASFSYPSQ